MEIPWIFDGFPHTTSIRGEHQLRRWVELPAGRVWNGDP